MAKLRGVTPADRLDRLERAPARKGVEPWRLVEARERLIADVDRVGQAHGVERADDPDGAARARPGHSSRWPDPRRRERAIGEASRRIIAAVDHLAAGGTPSCESSTRAPGPASTPSRRLRSWRRPAGGRQPRQASRRARAPPRAAREARARGAFRLARAALNQPALLELEEIASIEHWGGEPTEAQRLRYLELEAMATRRMLAGERPLWELEAEERRRRFGPVPSRGPS